ncbi:MAG: DNA alkylation repair protein [Candidatus Thiodiazotropha sp. (ex Codakia rugifera)]|nr:DNA alkylation repair protein [Candidatus Thiodiazotropha sp. (ex Codakia rugifera)]
MKAKNLSRILHGLADPAIASHSQRFFKTGKGEYGEGDRFLGIRVPVLRQQARRHKEMALDEILSVLKSPYHEERLCALLLLVEKYRRGSEEDREAIFICYLDNTRYINNWDLVDSTAYHIVGAYLEYKERHVLYEMAGSANLWERRIAIISTLHFIKSLQFDDTLKLSLQLMDDDQDLIHKAVGWMLREVGNRALSVEQKFLNRHYQQMPRTMLRYAIEKFPQNQRLAYLRGEV